MIPKKKTEIIDSDEVDAIDDAIIEPEIDEDK